MTDNHCQLQAADTGKPRGFARRMFDRMCRFASAREGNVALIFGLLALPVIMAGGAAVDYSRAFVVQQRLTAALDAAALAVATSQETQQQELEAVAQSYFDANYPAAEIGAPGTLNLSVSGSTVTLSADADLPTTIMHVAGIDNMDVHSEVEVTKERNALEVALVLDNTGSMQSYGKINALKVASHDLVNIMFGEETQPELLKFALVPFAASVNVGTNNLNSGWMDLNGQSSYHGVQFRQGAHGSPLKNVFGAFDDITNKTWNGCVEARPAPYDTTDEAPDATDGDTLWVPYFAPDEPDSRYDRGYYYSNNYMSDRLGRSERNVDNRQRHRPKYQNASASGDGPHKNCRNQPITPLTNNKATIDSAIDNMGANGNTVIPIGLAWGWRVLSPSAPFTEGASYTDEEVKKVLILLTDGENYLGSLNNPNKSWYSGYGYVSYGRLGTTNVNNAVDELNRRTGVLCDNIKQAGITVYTITFRVTSSTIRNLMRECASAPSKFFNSPSNSQLNAAFEEIADQLSKLRISR